MCHGGNEVWVCLGGVHALPLHLSRRDRVVGKFNLDSIRHGLLFREAALTRPTSRPPPKTRPDTCEMATLMQSILFSNSPAVCVPGDAVVDRHLPRGGKGGNPARHELNTLAVLVVRGDEVRSKVVSASRSSQPI